MDLIRLRELTVPVQIGTREGEADRRQPVVIDLELECDLAAAGRSDNLADAPDYSEIEQKIYEYATGTRFQLLEKLAADTARIALENPLVRGCRVTLGKPRAPRHARTVEVEIVRRKDN